MVEAGADEVPEERILEAFELAQGHIRTICEALEDLREQAGKPKWVDTELTDELEAEHGEAVRAAIATHGLREAATVVDALVAEASPEISMASTEDDMTASSAGAGELLGDPREGTDSPPSRARCASSSSPTCAS